MIRVAVVEDQTLVRQGITGLLSMVDDVAVVGEAPDGAEALRVIEQQSPDVVVLDLRLPVLDGIGVLERLQQRGRSPAVLVLTTFADEQALVRAVQLGARGFLLKDVSLDQLADALRVVAGGGELIHPALSAQAAAGLRAARQPFPALDLPDKLTRRERAVLRLLAAGCSNREIASALDLAPGTVKNHISSILSKLGVRDRTRAVLRAFELRYL